MFGKFIAMATWSQVVAFSKLITDERFDGNNDEPETLKVMSS
jgi:hypothetical protein